MEAKNRFFADAQPSKAELERVLASPEGRQLLAALRKNGGAGLQSAVEQARGGDVTQAKALIDRLLQDKQTAALFAQLFHG